MPKITISYRRADAPSDAGRIFDRLASRYGADSVFMDIDTIPFGVDFRDYIDGALRKTDIVLAVIGPRWLGRRGARARIREETDPVRIEIDAAMRLGKVVVPVLVANAVMPGPNDLPESLAKFAFLNAAEVDPGKDFHANLDRLIRFIDALPTAGAASAAAPPAAAPGGAIKADAALRDLPIAGERVEAEPPQREAAAPMPASPGPCPSLARRITQVWWISLLRGVTLVVLLVAIAPGFSDSALSRLGINAIVQATALLAMARAARGKRGAVALFLIAAVCSFGFVVLIAGYDAVYGAFGRSIAFRLPFFCYGCAGAAELVAGGVLVRSVHAERARMALGVVIIATAAFGVLAYPHYFPSAVIGVGSAAAAVAMIVLAWLSRREKVGSDAVAATA